MSQSFSTQYGPWAIVLGASEGLGAEFGRQLAERGCNVLLLARRQAALDEVAAEIRQKFPVEVRTAAIDLGAPSLPDKLRAATENLDIGLAVYNAAYSTIGEFLNQDLASQLQIVDVNCRGPVIVGHILGQRLAARGRGGLILMSSMAAGQGSPLIAAYAATKAFNLVFGEGLWEEFKRRSVDVVVCRAGATRTPNYARSNAKTGDFLLVDPPPVVRAALDSLGRRSSVVPGILNAVSSFFIGRVLPRRLAISVMGQATRRMYDA